MRKRYSIFKQGFVLFLFTIIIIQCSKGDNPTPTPGYSAPETPPEVTITSSNFSTNFNENPSANAVIGSIQATASSGSLNYTLVSESVEGAISVNATNGEISVSNVSAFDFETNTVITGLVRVTAGTVTQDITITINLTDVTEDVISLTLWEGPQLTFSKSNGADFNAESNQDRITDNVWITRANQGQIFNIATESTSNSASSPAGTAWAQGTFEDIASLTFTPFRDACPSGKPKNAVGIPMVVHLIRDNIYIGLRITSWATQKQGGFSYQRTTP